MDLLSLPDVMIEHIFSYLTYDEIAKLRQVSRTFNNICSKMLDRGFMMIEKVHSLALKNVKAQLPRRESERRYHPLARHCDILTSIETRISMLNMTYLKYIDHGLCCFIPGKVIDEIRRVLRIVDTKNPPRAHEVLQELRDISSMAIEHFDDKISPSFRKKLDGAMLAPRPASMMTGLVPASRQELLHLRRRSVLNTKLSLYLATQYTKTVKRGRPDHKQTSLIAKIIDNKAAITLSNVGDASSCRFQSRSAKLMQEYKRLACKQGKYIKELTKKQHDNDAVIAELKKRIEVFDVKCSEFTQADGGKIIAATSETEASTSSQPLRHFSSQIKLDLSAVPIGNSKRTHQNSQVPNIKPRKPLIRMPSLSEDDYEPPSKVTKLSDDSQSSSSSKRPALTNDPEVQSTLAKIRGLTSEIRHLSKKIDIKLKRPLDTLIDSVESKKSKLQ